MNITEDSFFNENMNINISKRNLPHWDQGSVWYSATFRLHDSIPQEKIREYLYQRDMWLKQHNNKNIDESEKQHFHQLFSDKVESWLTSGYGKCVLKQYEISEIVDNSIRYFNDNRYITDSWVIMPNHVHILFKPINNYNAQKIIASWKSYTANIINEKLNLEGQLWAHESYDHIVRDIEEFIHIRNYIANNPKKARINVHHINIEAE